MIEGIFAPALMPSSSQVSLEPCVQGARRRGVAGCDATPVDDTRFDPVGRCKIDSTSSTVHQQLSVEAAPTRAMVPGRGAIDQAPGAAVGAP